MGPLLLLKVSLLLAVTLVAARLLNRAPATARHGLWSLAFGSLLLLAPLAAMLPALHVPVPGGWETPAPSGVTSSSGWNPVSQSSNWATHFPPNAREISAPFGDVSVSQEARGTANWPSLSGLFFIAWLSGMTAAVITVFLSLLRVWRLVRTAETVSDQTWQDAAATIGAQLGVRQQVGLLVSDDVSTPMAGGVWRPAIFLPRSATSWSPEHRDLVLAHELAHLAGRDPLRHLMTRFALACYWFHPLAWLAAREAAMAREQACDEKVLSMGARPSAYARVLLDLAESLCVKPRARLVGALPMVHRSHLEKRLMAILNGEARTSTRRVVVGPAIGIALLTLSVAAAQPLDQAQSGPFDKAQGGPFDKAQGGPFDKAQGGPFDKAQSQPEVQAAPVGKVQGAPVGGVQGGRLGGVQGGPVGGVPGAPIRVAQGTPFRTVQGTPFGAADIARFADQQATPGRDSACWSDGYRGNFIGSSSSTQVGGRTVIYDQVGWRDGDRVIQRTFGDLRLCMLAEGAGDRINPERPSQWIGRARRVVMEAHRGGTVQRLEFNGTNPSWQVGGATRDFDSAAQTWRDRMLAVLDTTWELSTLRGEVSSLRGQISSIHGQRSSLQGEISSLQGTVSSMQGRISSILGEESSLRGQISSIQGHVSSLQGAISSQQGAISSLNSSRYNADAAERTRIASRIAEHNAQIARIEREIRDYDAERRIAAVQKELDSFDSDAKVAVIERQIRDFDLKGKVAAVQRRIADLDVEGQVARIERQIDALDADRRARQLDDRLDGELNRLNSAIAAIR
jgi:beta-lactamase regulating signal transducer with metallopeptidase domain/predicted  nucleic acid-binding Zn-ribbon protein